MRTRIMAHLGLAGLGGKATGVEVVAGFMGSLVSVAYCVSYSALMFGGPLQSGLALCLWSFLAATALATLIVAVTTTLPPGIAGPRNPTVAVMSVLVAGIAGTVLSRGGDPQSAVHHALIGLTIATLLTGAVLAALGTFRLGQAVRFIPYPVIAGFLAASGWLLIAGGVRVAYADPLDFTTGLGGLSSGGMARVAVAGLFIAAVQMSRRLGGGAAMLPALFFGMAIVLDLGLWALSMRDGWFLSGSSVPEAWSPLGAGAAHAVDWGAIANFSVEIGAVAGVAVMTLLLDVSQLEALRGQAADLDEDFRWNGIANLAVAPLGGAAVAMAPNSSRLIEEAGGRTRLAGLAGGVFVLGVVISGADIVALLPTPVLGGLLMLLGSGILRDALAGAPAGRTRLDLALTLAIMLAIVQFGYLPGVVLGLVAACMAFAVRYSRIGVIRRHVTRAMFAAPVERSAEDRATLGAQGGRIHVFWLSGFVFFGSSNGVFEEIRRLVGRAHHVDRRWVVLDLSGVTGFDASAMLSFAKLGAWAEQANVGLVWAGLGAMLAADFEAQGLSGANSRNRSFQSRTEALEACEEELLAGTRLPGSADGLDAFAVWLSRELGDATAERLIRSYLERRDLKAGDLVCLQGEPSDSIEFVAMGAVEVLYRDAEGRDVRVRRMAGRTVVGEMGFFRNQPRTTSVAADSSAVIYSMTRAGYERLAREAPQDAARFLELIVRQLADRVEFATKEIAALT